MFGVVCRVVEAEDEVMPLRLARIDAARGIGERIEYEVPMDPAGTSLKSLKFFYSIMTFLIFLRLSYVF